MSKQDVKVSIVVPVYNVAPYLGRCLDSLVGQTLRDIEIICVDDASTDNSLEILREYEKRDSRIHVIALGKNSGVATARNAGIDAARGEYLGFVDSDDFVDTNFYEKLYDAAKKTDADMARGNVEIIQIDGIRRTDADEINNIEKHGKWYFSWQWWCAIYRANMISMHNIRFPIEIVSGQDNVFLMECISHTNNVALCRDVFYHYARREGSLDETIMPPNKLESRVRALVLMSKIYNKTDMSQRDYNMRYFNLIYGLYSNFHKNTSERCRHMVAETVVDLYKQCKNKPEIVKRANQWGVNFIKCMQSHDVDGILECWNNTSTNVPTVTPVCAQKKTLYLFGVIPVATLKRTETRFVIRVCGIQILKTRNEYGCYRMVLLYIPIFKVKDK